MLHPDSTAHRLQLTPSAVLSSLSGAITDAAPFKMPPRALRKLREYVLAHIEENITIQALASIVGLSRFHLPAP